MAIFLPSFVIQKYVFGLPVINFLFLRVRRGRSSFRESGHSGLLEKQNAAGNKLKLSLINLSSVHFSPLLTIRYIPKRINSLIPRSLYNSLSKGFFIYPSDSEGLRVEEEIYLFAFRHFLSSSLTFFSLKPK